MNDHPMEWSRTEVYRAINNLYDDAEILVCVQKNDGTAPMDGHANEKHVYMKKAILMKHFSHTKQYSFSSQPDDDSLIILNRHLHVSRTEINDNQRFDTPAADVDGFHHVVNKGHHDVYFKIDHSGQNVTFRLGGYSDVVPLMPSAEIKNMCTGTRIYCSDSHALEKEWNSSGSADRVVLLGREMLRIPPAL